MANHVEKLEDSAIQFMMSTIGSLNSIAQNSTPRLTNNFTRTPLEDAKEAVIAILKLRAFAFSKIYKVRIGHTDQNVIFEKNPKSLFTDQEYQILLKDCESTPVDAEDFLAFVDKDEETILRDAAFVRNLAPNFGMFFANSDYENKAILERKQSTATQTTDSISAGVEATAGYNFLSIFGVKAKVSADTKRDNTKSVDITVTDSLDTNLTGIERTTTKVLASVYFIEKVYNLVNPQLPELAIMESLQVLDSINKDIQSASSGGSDVIGLLTADDTISAYNKAKEVLSTIQTLALAVCKTGILDTCGNKTQKTSREYMDAQLFWTGMQKSIKDNSNYTNSYMPYMRKNKDKNAIVHVMSDLVDAYNMANSVVSATEALIANTSFPMLTNQYQKESYYSGITSPNFIYSPEIFRIKGVADEKMVLLQNPYTHKKLISNTTSLDCDAIPLSLIVELFPNLAETVRLDTGSASSIQHFLAAVNATIKINEELNNAQFRLNISSKTGCKNLSNDLFSTPAFDTGNPNDRVLTAGYFDTNECPLGLNPEGNPDTNCLTFCEFKPAVKQKQPFEFVGDFTGIGEHPKNALDFLKEYSDSRCYPAVPAEPRITTLKL